jgi:signal transduction histidine kinase
MNLGRNIMELVHQADRGVIKEALCRVVAAPGRAERIEIRVLHQDGAWRDLEAIGVAIQENGDLPRIVVNCRDITERKQTAQSLQESLDRIKAVEERRRNFLSAVAHDLRTPLAVTIGAVDGLLTGRPGNVSQEQERMLAIVRRNAERLGRLFENLLDLAHSESGEIRIEPDLIDLATPVASAVECFRPLLGGRSLTICYHPPPEPVMVRADQDRIIQIVFNLLENSMRYAASSLTVEVGRTPTGEAELAIANDGPPIDPEYLTRIFEPYFSPEATTKKGRSGLGLAIVKTIVELHGGRVAALNLDHGVRFSVTLPRATNNGSGAKSDAGLKTGVPSGNGKR